MMSGHVLGILAKGHAALAVYIRRFFHPEPVILIILLTDHR